MRLVLAVAVAAFAFPLAAQTAEQPVRAITQDGRTILVHPDGTWEAAEPVAPSSDRPTSGPPPSPPAPPAPPPAPAPPRTVASATGMYELTFDASRWRESRQVLNADAEFQYVLPMGAGYAVTIPEVMSIPPEQMRDLVLAMAAEGTGSVPVLVSEARVEVEGGQVLRIEYRIKSGGALDMTFLNSIYSDDRGSLQVITWTATQVLPRFKQELIRFHDGLRLMPDDA